MLPGIQYTPDRLLDVLRRRAWILVVATLIGLGVAVMIARQLPDLYRSETVIMLEAQRIPDDYVKSISPAGGSDRVATLESQIRSRSRLEKIIVDLNLYAGLRRATPMQDVVERMNDDITVDTDKGSASVRVSYVNRDPRMAQRVTELLSGS